MPRATATASRDLIHVEGATAASLIVCTRDRSGMLTGCLDSILANQPSGWELIVVDDGSVDETAEVVEAARRSSEIEVVYVREPRSGLSVARNRGVAVARGDILLFTDDDVLVAEGWITAMLAGFDDPDVVAVAGRILPLWSSPPPAWLRGRHAGVVALADYGEESRELGRDEFPIGASMAVRRSALGSAGEPFNPSLGHNGRERIGFEEQELFARIRRMGKIVYRAEAVVQHRVTSARLTWQSIRRAAFQNGVGSARSERVQRQNPPAALSSLHRAVRTLIVARIVAWQNRDHDRASADDAFREFELYWHLGRHIEWLTAPVPRASRWLVRHLA